MMHVIKIMLQIERDRRSLKGRNLAWTLKSICVFTINSTYILNDWLSHLSSFLLEFSKELTKILKSSL